MEQLRSPRSLSETGEAHAAAFLERRLGATAGRRAVSAHARLLASALSCPNEPQQRGPSISLDGTALVYSCSVGDGSAPLRLLVEPGGLARSVPEQVDFSLSVLRDVLETLGWQGAGGGLRDLAAVILPASADEVRDLWGGVWLGLAVGERMELRLYVNLRHGNARSRWQRLADALGPFGDQRAAATFTDLCDRVAPHAIPVGVGVAVTEGRVRAIRLYAGMGAPGAASIGAVCGDDRSHHAAIGKLCDTLGPFTTQSVTVGFDFLLDQDGWLRPGIGRAKVDVDCYGRAPSHVLLELERLASAYELDYEELAAFLTDLDECFGGWAIHYASVGLRDGPAHLTVYAQPARYALQ